MGVVVNAPTPNETIKMMRKTIDIPIIVTVVTENHDFKGRLEAGVSIFNVSGAKNTPKIVRKIRSEFPEVPIIATGGTSEESILETISAGANAITFTPPTPGEIFSGIMDRYRDTL
jgi:2-keto-3-deoxy-6-phosphogluconate aldolase